MEIATGKDAYVKSNPEQYPSRKEALAKPATDNATKATAPAPVKTSFGKSK